MAQKITAIQFDARTVAPSAPIEAIPAGWYRAQITDGEIKATADTTGRRLALEFTVLEGQYKGRKIFDGLNIQNQNPEAQRIAQEQLSAICHAIQVFQIADVSNLFGKPLEIKVGLDAERWVNSENEEVEPNTPNAKKYDARNQFKGCKAATGPTVATGSTATPPPGALPGWTQPQGTTATPPPADAAKPKGKPGPKPKGKPAGAAAVAERMFYVSLDGPMYANAIPESKIVAMLAKGMPADTGICLVGEDAYKTPAEYGVGKAAPVVAAAAVDERPPWEQ